MKKIIGYDGNKAIYEEMGTAVGSGGLSHRQKMVINGKIQYLLQKTNDMGNTRRSRYLNGVMKRDWKIDNFITHRGVKIKEEHGS